MAKKTLIYKAIDGKKYKCRIIRLYESERFADIQLEHPNDDLFFVRVPLDKKEYQYKKAASLEVV